MDRFHPSDEPAEFEKGRQVILMIGYGAVGLLLEKSLRGQFDVRRAVYIDTALQYIDLYSPAVIVLHQAENCPVDINSIKTIRDKTQAPLIVMTSYKSRLDVCEAFHFGADDYIVQPFSQEELLARVARKVEWWELYQEAERQRNRSFETLDGRLRIDIVTREIWLNGMEVRLPQVEQDILFTLAKNPGSLVQRARLVKDCGLNSPNSLSAYIHRIRALIEPDKKYPTYLITHPIMGYQLMVRPLK